MAILNETKETLNKELGSPTKANILVGGDEHFQADEAWRYTVGRFEVTVGFRHGLSRYACFYKDPQDNPQFEDRDVEVSLALLAPASSWSSYERDADDLAAKTEAPWVICEYKTPITDIAGNKSGIIACHRTIKPHFLAYTQVNASPQTESPDDRLNELLLNLNTDAKPEKKLDAAIAAINELAAQQRAMRERMLEMREGRSD